MGYFTNVLFRKWPMNPWKLREHPPLYRCAACIGLILILCCIPSSLAAEAGRGQVEEFTGYLEPGDIMSYTIPGLLRGDVVSALAEGRSGNLDPFLALSDTIFPPDRVLIERCRSGRLWEE